MAHNLRAGCFVVYVGHAGEFKVSGLRYKVRKNEIWIMFKGISFRFRVQNSEFRVQGLEFRVCPVLHENIVQETPINRHIRHILKSCRQTILLFFQFA